MKQNTRHNQIDIVRVQLVPVSTVRKIEKSQKLVRKETNSNYYIAEEVKKPII